MPAWGLKGGGPMNDGQLSDLIEYLHSFQIPQNEELLEIEGNINSSLLRIENSDLQVESEIAKQNELINDIEMAPIRLPIAIEAVEIVSALISRQSGIDTDEDGFYDSVETYI